MEERKGLAHVLTNRAPGIRDPLPREPEAMDPNPQYTHRLRPTSLAESQPLLGTEQRELQWLKQQPQQEVRRPGTEMRTRL